MARGGARGCASAWWTWRSSGVRRRLWTDAATAAWIDERIPELESGATTPYAVADALLARSGELLAGARTR